MDEIDHEYTDELVCPWCGFEEDASEYDDELGNMGLIECSNCEKEFYGSRMISVSYSTEKAEYGTCSECGAENVIITSGEVFEKEFKNLCEKCQHEFLRTAFEKYCAKLEEE